MFIQEVNKEYFTYCQCKKYYGFILIVAVKRKYLFLGSYLDILYTIC